MITENVNNLFLFIDFLHSNTEYLLSKQDLINKVMDLHTKRNTLKPYQNYKDKIEYDKVQAEFTSVFDIVTKETTTIILQKINENKIADISDNIINIYAQGDLFELQRNFNENDLNEIFEAKRKYLLFRNKTNFHYFLEFFFYELDDILKGFFDYFKETTVNEFESFETKPIKTNDINEMVELFKQGHKVFTLPHDFFNSNIEIKQVKETGQTQNPLPLKSKLEFTKDKLRVVILELANLYGYQNPSTYLDDILKEIERFDDFDFKCSFFLNIHYLCSENVNKFWNEGHRKDITQWLKKAPIITDVFETTWEQIEAPLIEPKNEIEGKILTVLNPLKNIFQTDSDFQKAITEIQNFFTNKNRSTKAIFVKNGNIKNLAFALGEIWRSQRNEVINADYLQFYKDTFSIFKEQNLNLKNIFSCNLYKYSISKT